MRPQDLPAIAEAMATAGVARLELTGPDECMVLCRGTTGEPLAVDGRVSSGPEPAPDAVPSPGVGTFLRTHPLHDRALVASGDTVAAGQPLGVLRVGLLLLPVPAPSPGLLVAAAVEDGTLVGYGDRLFDLLPQD